MNVSPYLDYMSRTQVTIAFFPIPNGELVWHNFAVLPSSFRVVCYLAFAAVLLSGISGASPRGGSALPMYNTPVQDPSEVPGPPGLGTPTHQKHIPLFCERVCAARKVFAQKRERSETHTKAASTREIADKEDCNATTVARFCASANDERCDR